MWIIDASVAVRWFLEDEFHEHADQVLDRIVKEPGMFAVPELFAFEVYSVLMRLHPDGLLAFSKGIIPILHSGIFRQPMTPGLACAAAELINRGLSGYDACYAALSRDMKGQWLTFDEKAHRMIEKEKISCLLDNSLPADW